MKNRTDFLIALFLCGFLAVNFPLLSLFNKAMLCFGIPVLYLYLFLVWAIFIGCMVAVMEKRETPPPPHNTPGAPKSN